MPWPRPAFSTTSTWSVTIAVAIVALGLRLLGPVETGLWFDEVWLMVDFGSLPVGEVLTTYGSDNNHPLYTLLAWLSMRLTGPTALGLRLPAIVFGALGCAALWRFGCSVTGRFEVALATVLLVVSYHHVWFSQNARGYTALMFFAIVATHGFVRILDDEKPPGLVPVALYGGALALGTYTHVTAVFVAVAHALVAGALAIRSPARRGRVWLVGLGLAVAALGSLALHAAILREMLGFLLGGRGGQPGATSTWQTPGWMLLAAVESLGVGLVLGGIVAVVGGTIVVVGSWSYARTQPHVFAVMLLPGVLQLLFALGLGRNLWPRFFFFLAGFALLLVSRGALHLGERSWRAVKLPAWSARWTVAVAAMGASLVLLPRAYGLPKQDFEGARDWAKQQIKRDRDHGLSTQAVAVGLALFPYERYFGGDIAPVRSQAELEEKLATHDGIYVLHTLPVYLESREPALSRRLVDEGQELARFCGSVGGGDVLVLYLGRPRAEPSESLPPGGRRCTPSGRA